MKSGDPLKLVLYLVGVAASEEEPGKSFVSRVLKSRFVVEHRFSSAEYVRYLEICASVCSFLGEREKAAHLLALAGAREGLASLARLCLVLGDYDGLTACKHQACARGWSECMVEGERWHDFLRYRALEEIEVSGHTWGGFSLQEDLLEKIITELVEGCAYPDRRTLLVELVRDLKSKGCRDELKLYILATRSGDNRLMLELASPFSRRASMQRERVPRMLREHLGDEYEVSVLQEGDTEQFHSSSGYVFCVEGPLGRELVRELVPRRLDPSRVGVYSQELEILSSISHECAPELLGVLELDGVELMRCRYDYGDFLSYCLEAGLCFSPFEAGWIARKLADFLVYMHERDILSLGVDDASLLWDGSRVIVMDFSRSRRLGGEGFVYAYGFASPYTPPELFLDSRVSLASDVFQWGVLVYRLVVGRYPFLQLHAGSLQDLRFPVAAAYGGPPVFDGLESAFDEAGVPLEIVRAALSRDPSSRPSASDLSRELSFHSSFHHCEWP